MDQREFNIQVFNETKSRIEHSDKLWAAVQNTKGKTVVYPEQGEITLPEAKYSPKACRVEVSGRRTFEAAERLLKEFPGSRVGVLNFASATNPGGGVTKGSNAQEEGLCRCSTLYSCLYRQSLRAPYYDFHRKRADALYTDTCIYTPDIVVFRADTPGMEILPEEDWYSVDVISCAAPNLRSHTSNCMNPDPSKPVTLSKAEQISVHMKRGRKILSVAAANGIDVMVLGAFGCGAFRNDPEAVAEAYRRILPEFKGYFRAVEFAVYCTPNNQTNFRAFQKALR